MLALRKRCGGEESVFEAVCVFFFLVVVFLVCGWEEEEEELSVHYRVLDSLLVFASSLSLTLPLSSHFTPVPPSSPLFVLRAVLLCPCLLSRRLPLSLSLFFFFFF